MRYFIEVPTKNTNDKPDIQKQITDQLSGVLFSVLLLFIAWVSTSINSNLQKIINKMKHKTANSEDSNLIYIKLGELKQILQCDRIFIIKIDEKELKIEYEYNDQNLRKIELGEFEKYENEINYLKVRKILYLNSNDIDSEFVVDKNEEIILILIDREWILSIYYLLKLKTKIIDSTELENIKNKINPIIKELKGLLNES